MRLESFFAKTAMAAAGYLLLGSAAMAQESGVSGRVTDSHGLPVSGVMVVGTQYLSVGGPKELRVSTDAEGRYSLAPVGAIVFFRKSGYRPVTYKRTPNETTLDITLPLEDSGWKVPGCTNQQLHQHRRYGDSLLFLAPRSAKAKEGEPDADNRRVFLSYPGNRKEEMIVWSGPLVGGGFGFIAPQQWYTEATTISERGDKDSGVIDVRGTTPEGRHWRSISWFADIVWYHDASDGAAKFFDKIIETGCLRIP